jgi:hypothetical protein
MLRSTISLSFEETEKLLSRLGHEPWELDKPEVIDLIRILYRAWAVLDESGSDDDVSLSLGPEHLILIHRAFDPDTYGLWAHELRAKLARAFIQLDRLETIPGLDDIAVVDGAEDRADVRLRLAEWREREGSARRD